MRSAFVLAAAAVAVLAARPARAQGRDNTIDPGMSKAQVIEHLGQPVSVKTSDTLTFMFYANGCEKTCGMQDIVTLSRDKVVDAIFRDPKRHYTGESSSPNMVTAAEAIKQGKERKAGAPPAAAPAPAPAPKADTGAKVLPSITPPPAPLPPKGDSVKPKADSAAAKPPAA
ncbi:MAG TPA: hypothetical protein VMT93_08925 [Gemmatimonadaceae bacterium]|nr:hypothetical protein [Gemmatimonadaceae bacterium]